MSDIPYSYLEKYLQNASYPISRDDLYLYAQKEGADDITLEALSKINDIEYENLNEVFSEIQKV